MNALPALAIGVLFGTGIHLMTRRDAVKLAAGTVLITNAAVLLLISAGFGAYAAPLLPVDRARDVADPLVQALALTAVVIGFGVTVLLLRITLAVERSHGTIDMQDLAAAESEDEEQPPGDAQREEHR